MSLKNIAVLGAEADVHEVVVVVFDMCSSSKLLEDLTRTNSLQQYDRLLKNLRAWLANSAVTSGYVPYKFTGDGWILLFPSRSTTGTALMAFLKRLCERHQKFRQQHIDAHLESTPESVGLTLGVDMGLVRKVLFGPETEFFGRPINVACRLQSAVKDKKPGPDYRCLMSRKVYNSLMKDVDGYFFGPAERTLRNISSGEKYQCYKVDFSKAMQ